MLVDLDFFLQFVPFFQIFCSYELFYSGLIFAKELVCFTVLWTNCPCFILTFGSEVYASIMLVDLDFSFTVFPVFPNFLFL